MGKYKYQKDGYKPSQGEIFVFGSNLAGVHGAGAAREALMTYGAVMHKGVGLCGQSYALPTKDYKIQTMRLSIIGVYVTRFIRFASAHPELEFYVSAVGCGLAGYDHSQIAPLFIGAPENCSFCDHWKQYLEV